MNKDHTYTLAELAEETGLTGRTVRYYIEQVLPPHHKQGRGKLARYGQDTLNCIRFILLVGERYGFKPGQAKGVLADVPQETIDRVVRGEEELAVMTVPSAPVRSRRVKASRMPRAKSRMAKYMEAESQSHETARPIQDRLDVLVDAEMFEAKLEQEVNEPAAHSESESAAHWRTIFADGQVRVQCRGERRLTSHQREQIEAAARLIELALR
ncbi:MAG: MerR family transcriptional regulator [Xanthomonadales bacterium]|nr:MerR family transcriptional regulator [Xanthomonadales bacterium]